MALNSPDDALARAVELARGERPEAWPQVAASAMERVRAFVTPSVPLHAFAPDGGREFDDRGSTTRVASRVVKAALRAALDTATHTPDALDLLIEEGRLVGVEVALVGSYGTDLHALAEEVRTQVRDVVRDLLGVDPDLDDAYVAVRIVDVVVGDPRLR